MLSNLRSFVASSWWKWKVRLLRKNTKKFLRLYERGKLVPSVRAVFIGDFVSRRIILDGMYEKRELFLLSQELFPLLPRDSTALDIGANIGNHATFFAEYFDRVVAFEPNPMVTGLLYANSIGRAIEVVEIGLSNTADTLNFKVNGKNIGGSRITDEHSNMKIVVDKLDSLVDTLDLHNVSFVKIDVEEHEHKVIDGRSKFLSMFQPVIAMEGHYKSNHNKGVRVTARLRELGYRYFYALSDRRTSKDWSREVTPKFLRSTPPLKIQSIESLAGSDHAMAVISVFPIK